ncbi:unnamed protein product [Prorocentrum cordatum]|uniref:Uncharacterized protein n=1 Tax=Prorocentrum cordatum TaxID=2364126 RepID=A0ABN9T5L3_9DINO|nr:unnamed protein product [Polarella glacialis]
MAETDAPGAESMFDFAGDVPGQHPGPLDKQIKQGEKGIASIKHARSEVGEFRENIKARRLEDEVKKNLARSEASTAASGTSAAGSTASDDDGPKGKKAKTGASGKCTLDGKDVKPGKRYCEEHNTTHECIRRKACKGLNLKAGESNKQWDAYQTLFGCRKHPDKYPGDAEAADKVVAEYHAKYPPCEKGVKTGKSRGELDLTQYAHVKGASKHKADLSERPKWDKEIFCTQLRSIRGWMPAKCEKLWDELAANPENHADNLGYDPKAPLRLFVPPALIGTDKEQSGATTYEAKEVRTTSKQQKHMDEDAKEALLDATKKGFGTLTGVTTAQLNTASSLPSGSASVAEVEELLLSAVGETPTKSSGASADADGKGDSQTPGGGQCFGDSGGAPAGSPDANKGNDVRVARNALVRKINTMEYGKKEGAIKKLIGACVEDLWAHKSRYATEEYKALLERLDLLLAIIGQARKINKNGDGSEDDPREFVDIQDPGVKPDDPQAYEKHQATAQNVLDHLARISDMQITGLGDLRVVSYKDQLVKQTQDSTTQAGLANVTKLLDAQMALMTNVMTGCKVCLADFKKAVKLMQKEDEVQAQLEESRRKERAEKSLADERASLQTERFKISAAAFHGDYEKNGHKNIVSFPSVKSARASLEASGGVPEPFIVDCKEVFAAPNSMTKTQVTMTQWEPALKAKCTRSNSIYEEAAMHPKMGLDEVKKFMDIFPPAAVHGDDIPDDMKSFFAAGPISVRAHSQWHRCQLHRQVCRLGEGRLRWERSGHCLPRE